MKEDKIEFIVRHDGETIEARVEFHDLKPMSEDIYDSNNTQHKADILRMEAVVALNNLMEKYSG